MTERDVDDFRYIACTTKIVYQNSGSRVCDERDERDEGVMREVHGENSHHEERNFSWWEGPPLRQERALLCSGNGRKVERSGKSEAQGLNG
jgi:hypothetical protein